MTWLDSTTEFQKGDNLKAFLFNIVNLLYHFAHWKTTWIYDVVYCWIKTSLPKSHGVWILQLLSCFRELQFIYQENHSSEVHEVFHSLKLWHSYASLKGKERCLSNHASDTNTAWSKMGALHQHRGVKSEPAVKKIICKKHLETMQDKMLWVLMTFEMNGHKELEHGSSVNQKP